MNRLSSAGQSSAGPSPATIAAATPGIPAALREAKDMPAAFRRAGERLAHDGQRFRAVRIASF